MTKILVHTGPLSHPQPILLPVEGLRAMPSQYVFSKPLPKPPEWAVDKLGSLTAEEQGSASWKTYLTATAKWEQDKADREDAFHQQAIVWYGAERWVKDSPESDRRDTSMPVHETMGDICRLLAAAGHPVIGAEDLHPAFGGPC